MTNRELALFVARIVNALSSDESLRDAISAVTEAAIGYRNACREYEHGSKQVVGADNICGVAEMALAEVLRHLFPDEMLRAVSKGGPKPKAEERAPDGFAYGVIIGMSGNTAWMSIISSKFTFDEEQSSAVHEAHSSGQRVQVNIRDGKLVSIRPYRTCDYKPVHPVEAAPPTIPAAYMPKEELTYEEAERRCEAVKARLWTLMMALKTEGVERASLLTSVKFTVPDGMSSERAEALLREEAADSICRCSQALDDLHDVLKRKEGA